MSFCYARLREIRSYNAEGRLRLKELNNINTKEPSVGPKLQLTEITEEMFGYLRSERLSYKRKCKGSISHLYEYHRF